MKATQQASTSLTSHQANWNAAFPTLKLWSCSEASLSCLRQELKMRSSVSRSHAFSSLMRASSCSRSELVSGERAERGFSTATPRPPTSKEFVLADWFCWEELGPECSERIFWKTTEERGKKERGEGVSVRTPSCVNIPSCKVAYQSIHTWSLIIQLQKHTDQ